MWLPRGGRLLAFVRDSPRPNRNGPKALKGGVGGGGIGGGLQGGGGGAGGLVGGGGVRVGQFGVVGLGGGGGAPLTSPCPLSNHTITINLTLTFAASWFGHASHVDWAEQDPANFVHGGFCHIIALHFGPQHAL